MTTENPVPVNTNLPADFAAKLEADTKAMQERAKLVMDMDDEEIIAGDTNLCALAVQLESRTAGKQATPGGLNAAVVEKLERRFRLAIANRRQGLINGTIKMPE